MSDINLMFIYYDMNTLWSEFASSLYHAQSKTSYIDIIVLVIKHDEVKDSSGIRSYIKSRHIGVVKSYMKR